MGEDGRYYTTYDIKEAKALLTAAGYPNGLSYDIRAANIASYTVTYPMIELVQSMVADAGLKQNLKIIDYATHLRTPTPTNGMQQQWIVRGDIESFVYSSVYYKIPSAIGKNQFQVAYDNDPEYRQAAALMEKQRQTLDLNERKKLVHDLQRIWARNLWTFYYPVPDSPVIANRKVHNFIPTPGWNAGVWKYVWLEG
jgi:ABC-type transport system substrate-binding protein